MSGNVELDTPRSKRQPFECWSRITFFRAIPLQNQTDSSHVVMPANPLTSSLSFLISFPSRAEASEVNAIMVSDGCGLRGGRGANALVFFCGRVWCLVSPGLIRTASGPSGCWCDTLPVALLLCVSRWWRNESENLTARWYLAKHADATLTAILENQKKSAFCVP